MDKLKFLFKKIIYNPLGFALFSNLIAVICGCILSHSFFEENDDLGMALIAEGAYGKRDWHMLYTNALWAKVTVFMQTIIPSVRWHIVFQIVFVFIAFVAVTFILAHYKYGKMLSIMLEVGLCYELYTSIQFAKTSAFAACVGALILVHHLGQIYSDIATPEFSFSKTANITLAITGVILMLYAVLLRNDAYLVGIVPAAVTGAAILFSNIKNGGIKRFVSYVVVALVAASFFLVFTAINSAFYKHSDKWVDYLEFQDARVALLDNRQDALDYSSNGEELSAIGVSANDAFMYATWQIGDESIVTTDLFYQILDAAKPKRFDVDFIKAYIASLYEDVLIMSPVILSFVIAVFTILACSGLFSWGSIYAAIQLLMVFVVTVFVHYFGRWNHRLIYALILTTAMAMIVGIAIFKESVFAGFSSTSGRTKPDIKAALYIAVGILAVGALTKRLENEFSYQEYLRSSNDFAILKMYMEEEKNHLFVVDTFTIQDYYRYDVFDAVNEGALDNCVSSGSWMTGTPIEHAILDKYGYSDSFAALRQGGAEEVYLVDNYFPERKAGYINDHGSGPRYAAEFVEDICGYKLYRIK